MNEVGSLVRIWALGLLLLGMGFPGRSVIAEKAGDVRSSDDFKARWEERKRTKHETKSSHHKKHREHRKSENDGTTEQAQETQENQEDQSTTTSAAPVHAVHEGVIHGTLEEQQISWHSRATGEEKMIPRLVLVGWSGDRALLPEAARGQLTPYIGKEISIACTAVAVISRDGNIVHHNLVVERVFRVEPYVDSEAASQAESTGKQVPQSESKPEK